jgi:glycosyltransferase involved in cell wall biosynthesis
MVKVSVCVPTYNGADFIASTLKSILNQTYANFELIVCDDHSSDDTLEIVNSFHDNRLHVERNPERLGLVGNWNRCIDLASGEYIIIFHQDDIMYPDNIKLKVEFLDKDHAVGFVHSDIDYITENGDVVAVHWVSQPTDNRLIKGEEFFAKVAVEGRNPVACPAVVVRRACFDTIGYFDERLPFTVDLEMWLRLAAHYPVGYIAAKLVAHRLHKGQEGSRFRNTGHDALDFLKALDITHASSISDEHRRQIPIAYKTIYTQSIGLAKWQAKLGHIENSLRYVWAAILANSRFRLTTKQNSKLKYSD